MNTSAIFDLTATLANLDDEKLWHQSIAAARQEKQSSAAVIAHIAEVRRRMLFLVHACKSLYDYCRTVLGFSEAESYLRSQVAGACGRHPELLADLAEGKISLCVASKLAAQLTEKNKKELLPACHGKSKHQAELVIATHNPASVVDSPAHGSVIMPLTEREFVIRCGIDKESLAVLERCAELLEIADLRAGLPPLKGRLKTAPRFLKRLDVAALDDDDGSGLGRGDRSHSRTDGREDQRPDNRNVARRKSHRFKT